MIKKSFANSSLELPALGQGMGAYKWGDEQVELIRLGIKLGMNLVDTAEEYDNGQSEEIIGEAIRGQRDGVIVATKFSPQHSAYGDVLKSAEGSLRRLKTDYIDIYQLHWPNPKVPIRDTFSALQKLVDDGKIRFVGVCNLLRGELEKVREVFLPSRIITLQSEYNLFDRFVEKDILSHCLSNDMALIAYSPLDKGRISDDDEKKSLLDELGEKYNKTASQIALRWLVSHPSVVAIPKSATMEHLVQNAESTDFEIGKEDFERISNVFERLIEHISPKNIEVTMRGEGNRATYCTLDEALENKLDFVPSPLDLSQSVKTFSDMKPVRLIKHPTSQNRFILVEGRIRFWAWIIAFGEEKPLPAYIRKNWHE